MTMTQRQIDDAAKKYIGDFTKKIKDIIAGNPTLSANRAAGLPLDIALDRTGRLTVRLARGRSESQISSRRLA